MTRTSGVALWSLLALSLLLAGVEEAQPQGQGTPRRVRIRFISDPDRAQFEFTFNNQKVTGRTPSTKVFTLSSGSPVRVVFKRQDYNDCLKTFSTSWSEDGRSGTLIVDKDNQAFSFSTGAKP